jgi:transcription elongation factor Elf1
MAWTKKQRHNLSETMKLVALFRKCQECKRENATTLRRTRLQTWADCRYCGRSTLMVQFTEK